MTEIARL